MSDQSESQEIVTRAEAIERGLTKYFTGEPCKRGHVSVRWTIAGACIQCVEEKKAAERARIEAGRQKAAEREAA